MIEPYYKTKLGQLYLGNNLDLLSQLDKESVDAVITDPPYNISRKTNFATMKGRRGTVMDFGDWDKESDILSWIDLIPNIVKKQSNILIFNDWKNLSYFVDKLKQNNFIPKRCIVLNKTNPAPFNRDRLFVNNVEFAIWATSKKWTFNRIDSNFQSCVFSTKVQSKKFHPTMKDIEVIKKIINILTNPGDLVLDPFIGSGTTALACEGLNRRWIAMEKEEKYCNTVKKRLIEYQENNQDIFDIN